MLYRHLCYAAMLSVVLSAGPVLAADPPPAEQLPPPRDAVPPPPHAVVPPPVPLELMLFPRHDRYAVWQNYGVNRYGQWRPLVISTGEGAYYRYNGAPFPWASVHPEEYVPRAIHPASFR